MNYHIFFKRVADTASSRTSLTYSNHNITNYDHTANTYKEYA